MRLERHVGGLGKARQHRYLTARGWRETEAGWTCARHTAEPLRMSRALHHQLTEDLCAALAPAGWQVTGFSPRGYVKLTDKSDGSTCTLPAALRRQAKREGRRVGELTYSLFLATLLDE